MAEIKIAGIMRAGAYSPNHIGNDAAIFNLVAEQLRKRGCEVNVYSEEQFAAGAADGRDIIVNMCREQRSIEMLQQLEDAGALVINSGYGIENCSRERVARILIGSDIPMPDSLIVNTDEMVRDTLARRGITQCWVKRGDYAMHKEDVTYVRHPEEAQEMLQEYFLRGIKRAVIARHLEGGLIKFYGILGTPFFYWFFPFEADLTRYGKGYANNGGDDMTAAVDTDRLRRLCENAAQVLDVKIYGGDAIISPEGELRIIDFNDWPSFAPCRSEAAPQIARFIMGEIKAHITNKKTTGR